MHHWQPGTFLVRESDTTPGDYTFSVRDLFNTKHIKIHRSTNGGVFLFEGRTPMATIRDLIHHHAIAADGLVQKLTVTCPRLPARREASTKVLVTAARTSVKPAGDFGDIYSVVRNNGTAPASALIANVSQVTKNLIGPNLVFPSSTDDDLEIFTDDAVLVEDEIYYSKPVKKSKDWVPELPNRLVQGEKQEDAENRKDDLLTDSLPHRLHLQDNLHLAESNAA